MTIIKKEELKNDYNKFEKQMLSKHAQLSSESKGRSKKEAECVFRNVFQRDKDRILHSKSFRRLKQKTQVFIVTEGDHFRTRLTHTLEVAQIARTLARALKLNEDLVEAIALGHDVGHTPFGHAGERSLRERLPNFNHNEQSLRVVEHLERDGKGLNLTWEVKDGILNHRGATMPSTWEGQIVKICDRVAYINHDIDDAIRAGILEEKDLPGKSISVLGKSSSQRIDKMVCDLYENTQKKEAIAMSAAIAQAMEEMRNFLFAKVYMREEAKEQEKIIKKMLLSLFDYFMLNPQELPEPVDAKQKQDQKILVGDYIAGMTDNFAMKVYEQYLNKKL